MPLVIQAGFHNGIETILSRICENRILCQKLIQIGIWRITARTQMIERVLETIFGRNRTHSNPFLLGIIHISSKLKIRQNLFADGSVAVAFDDIIVESCKECLVLLFAVAPFALHCGQKVPSMLADMTSASPGFHPARGLFLTSVVRA
mgnify:FL=1